MGLLDDEFTLVFTIQRHLRYNVATENESQWLVLTLQ